MHPVYPNVFSPIRLGPVEIPNRFFLSPQPIPMTIGSKPSDDYIRYIAARVEGGCGLVHACFSNHPRGRLFQPSGYPREHVGAFRALADTVHDAGGRIFGELWYYWGSPGQWQTLSPQAPTLGPSGAHYMNNEICVGTRPMSVREIEGMLACFRQSAENLRDAGFDGLMVHAAHGALAEQFLSPYFNRRKDEWGGSLENRMRFLVRSLEIAREVAGDRMAVGIRFNCDEMIEGGYDQSEAFAVLKTIADAGLIDFADLDVAIGPTQFDMVMPSSFVEPQPYRPFVAAMRAALGDVKVASVLGRITRMADAEEALASGVCDMVGAGRQLIAEPDFVRNARNDREERSRTCIACNACLASVAEGAIVCPINPHSFRERFWGAGSLERAPALSKVVVVGGGPGGLEAARIAALRGHAIVLIEARSFLGGAFELWARLPGREVYRKAIDWWTAELARLDVEVRLDTRATAASILAEAPDAVILATGALYERGGRGAHRDRDIPGHNRAHVIRPEEILLGERVPSGRVLIQDNEGLHTGVGLAELLAAQGCVVELLTPHFAPAGPRIKAVAQVRPIMERLHAAGVTLSATSYIRSIGPREVEIEDVFSGKSRIARDVDAVVLSTGRAPVNALEAKLEGKVGQLFVIGDALAARTWSASTFEAHKFARLIGEPDAPASITEVYFADDDPLFAPKPVIEAPRILHAVR